MNVLLGPFDKRPLPPVVDEALRNLRAVCAAEGVALADAIGVTPNQSLMWDMNDRVTALRKLLDRLAPGWDDDL